MIHRSYADYAGRYLADHLVFLQALPLDTIGQAVALCWDAYQRGATIFLCGNGGSAAMASHFAADLNKTTLASVADRSVRRFRAVSLADNMALMTAWGNDVAYHRVFAEQLINLGQPGDVLVAISGSGNSPNIVAAVVAANDRSITTIGLTGKTGGRLKDHCNLCIQVGTDDYAHNEPLHSAIFHLMTFYLREWRG